MLYTGLAVKIWANSRKGLLSYNGLNLWGAFFPKVSAPCSSETICRMQIHYGGARMV